MDIPTEIEIPRLFADFESHHSPEDQRAYIEQQLVSMQRAGKLVLTHIINQRPPVCHLAKDVMCGSGISDGTDGHGKGKFHTDWPVPDELEDARAVIESMTEKPVFYYDGYERITGIVRSVGRKQHKVPQQRERLRDTKKTVAELPLRSAIIALDQYGAYVKYAPDEDAQRKHWLCIEAHPELPWYGDTQTGKVPTRRTASK